MDDFRILCRDWQDPDGHQIVKYVFKSEPDPPFENLLGRFFQSTVVPDFRRSRPADGQGQHHDPAVLRAQPGGRRLAPGRRVPRPGRDPRGGGGVRRVRHRLEGDDKMEFELIRKYSVADWFFLFNFRSSPFTFRSRPTTKHSICRTSWPRPRTTPGLRSSSRPT